MRIISGIYKIVNTKNGKFYVGSSKNIIRRFGIHKSALNHNRHHCIHLQRSWNKHGAATFSFEIIKQMDHPTEEQLLEEELKFITSLLPSYNVGGVGGGDNLTNNPNRGDIIKRMTLSLRERISKMSEEERKRIWGHSGNTNFNWKGGVSSPTCEDCGKPLFYGHTHCSKCSKIGTRNPFHGKSHSQATRVRLSEINKGKLPPNLRPVKIEGNIYVSVAEAARRIGVCNATILFRIKSKYWDYIYVTPQSETQFSGEKYNSPV